MFEFFRRLRRESEVSAAPLPVKLNPGPATSASRNDARCVRLESALSDPSITSQRRAALEAELARRRGR